MRTSRDSVWKVTFLQSGGSGASREEWVELELKEEYHTNGLMSLVKEVLERYDKGELNDYLLAFRRDPWDDQTKDKARIITESLVKREEPGDGS